MDDQIISLSWEQLDALTEFVEQKLSAQGIPTILRLRTQMVLEEFFSAAMAAPGSETARMRCVCPAPRTVVAQCRSTQPDYAPDWADLLALNELGSTYGLKITVENNACTILVGQK